VERFSLEQLEVLMLVAGSDEPIQTAVDVRRRWRYLLAAARAAAGGQVAELGLPQIRQNSQQFAVRAAAIVAVLDQWLAEHTGRSLPE